MLALGNLDLDEIASALANQTDYEHRWLIDPQTGEIAIWTSDTGIEGQHPVYLDELDLVGIDPLPLIRLVPGHGRLRRANQRRPCLAPRRRMARRPRLSTL